MTDDEMVGWHHRLHGREFEQTPRDGEGQGSLARCSPWNSNELDTTEQLNNNNNMSLPPQAPGWISWPGYIPFLQPLVEMFENSWIWCYLI